ncbi:MAG TPA: TrbG/VirB9 family P-type conjugative transfer protein [Steroidobacteraceae bacterium]|jgi:type IV secretion system protein VirB9
MNAAKRWLCDRDADVESALPKRTSRFSFAAALFVLSAVLMIASAPPAEANWVPARGAVDSRIRVAPYSAEQVYQLYGYVGYQIDIEFAGDEVFAGLAAGDMDGISFQARGNHLFLKPRVARVHTNLTVLTNRRQYEFEYSVLPGPPEAALGEVIFALRFTYLETRRQSVAAVAAKQIAGALAQASRDRPRNYDYWYCGRPELKPLAAWDDGVRTWFRFGARAELPAIFVQSDDGTEALVNFSVSQGDIVVQRIARRFVLRRGSITGCIINKAFTGGGERLTSHTVSSAVQRVTRQDSQAGGEVP